MYVLRAQLEPRVLHTKVHLGKYIYEGDVSANSARPQNVENIEIPRMAVGRVQRCRGCIGASIDAITALNGARKHI